MKAKEYTSNRIPNCFFKSFCYCIIYIKFRILIYLIFSSYPHQPLNKLKL